MFKKFLYIIVTTFILFLVAGLFLPRLVHVERSIEINRSASEIFELLNSYQQFESWSPWAARDPNAVYEYSGPQSGVGARMTWTGDPRLVGTGWQEIIESQANSLIRIRLDFDQQGPAESYYKLDETNSGVIVTWGFDTDLIEGQGFLGGFLAKYFGLFFDRWIGADYELGLANLKVLAEAMPEPAFPKLEIDVIDVQGLDILYVPVDVSQGSDDIAQALASAFQEISRFMVNNGLEMSGQPMAISRAWNEKGNQLDAAIPVVMKSIEPAGKLHAGKSPSGRAVRLIHRGPYQQMTVSYQKLAAYMAAHDLSEGDVSWEQYISDPGTSPENDLITHIYFLIGNKTLSP